MNIEKNYEKLGINGLWKVFWELNAQLEPRRKEISDLVGQEIKKKDAEGDEDYIKRVHLHLDEIKKLQDEVNEIFNEQVKISTLINPKQERILENGHERESLQNEIAELDRNIRKVEEFKKIQPESSHAKLDELIVDYNTQKEEKEEQLKKLNLEQKELLDGKSEEKEEEKDETKEEEKDEEKEEEKDEEKEEEKDEAKEEEKGETKEEGKDEGRTITNLEKNCPLIGKALGKIFAKLGRGAAITGLLAAGATVTCTLLGNPFAGIVIAGAITNLGLAAGGLSAINSVKKAK